MTEPVAVRPAGASATLAEVAALLGEPERPFLVAGHRKPDGDAVGATLGLARALHAAGRDVVVWNPDIPWVPGDLEFLLRPGEGTVAELPGDAGERTLVALDCASRHRLSDRQPQELAALVLNVDHHHDNTRFGDLNLIVPQASSAAEIVVALVDAAGLPLTREVAEPLYVGITTDTGRFCYSNTSAQTHRVAARLIEAGLDVAAIARRLYENQGLAQARLLGRALARAEALLGGRLVVAVLGREDFAAAGTDDTEGIAEVLRGIRGVEAAALARELPQGGGLRVSTRASSDRVDVSAIAREENGGGHRAAAGFTTQRSREALVAWLEAAVARQLDG